MGEAKKVMATFLTAVGAKTHELLKGIVAAAKPSELKLEEVVEHLNKHYDPKPLVIAERFKFHKRNQQADESLAEYCAAFQSRRHLERKNQRYKQTHCWRCNGQNHRV